MVKFTKKAKKAEEVKEVKEELKAEDFEKVAKSLEENVIEEKHDEIEKKIAEVEEKMEKLWEVNAPVYQQSSFIKTKVYTTPVPLYELPEDLRQYLINMWFWTNVYEKGEEWLHAHWADMEKIEELKKFISEHFRK